MDKALSFNGFGCKGENRCPQLSSQPAGRRQKRRHHRL